MVPEWKEAEKALNRIEVIANDNNQPVSVFGDIENLHCIGIGTDAAVFRFDKVPAYAFKVYTSKALSKKEIEENVYIKLEDSMHFPKYFGSGSNYLVLSYEFGVTLYDCLLQGIHIPKQVIVDVENARQFVRNKGLNPRDIHLKNVLLQNGRGKVLDVSEYVQTGNDYRWEHLVWAYDQFYPLIDRVPISSWILETIKHQYYRMDTATLALKEFSQRMKALFLNNKRG
ncbi:serine/threonine protein kinase [Aneurinibacillus sp. Ricciae_BoGa-3]|uniref:serine/threonine protein kinase n=1 Tax=Aneurinibacillus sp. Ricciae_BoGa-3 TaxID=3022697 RepID=UPI0023402AB6|nr:serine/threonine protein kinase [Aneurinibacillus sp. Ricciae_BoGa-3]WCK54891.1 serine/threonine protein kinase [Aneurinibacillus sp. Ricciae_BoGa-3]